MGLLNSNDDTQELIPFRSWVNKSSEHKVQQLLVRAIKLSTSKEWIKIETSETIAFLKTDSKVGEEFWSNLQHFNGKGKALVIYWAKGKLGFDLDFSDTETAYYTWVEEELIIGKKQKTVTNGISAINWKKAQLPSKNSVENTTNTPSTDKD